MDTTVRKDDGSEQDHDGEVVLDVRPLIERGEEPFGTIMETVADLDGRALVLVAPFEPTPLEGVLSAQGFSYRSEQVGESEWRVRFVPDGRSRVQPSAPADAGTSPNGAAPTPAHPTESPFTIKRRAPASLSAGASPVSSATVPGPTQRSTPASATTTASPMTMNPTLNVPPAWLPLGFLAAAGVGLVAFGAAVAITAPAAVRMPRDDHVITAVHLGVLAFLSTAVLGALHQFGPVVGGRPLRSVVAGTGTWLLFVPGVWLIPIGFATGHSVVLQVGGVLATTGVCIAAWNLSRPLSAKDKGAPIMGLRLAVAYLLGTVAFGIVYAFDRSSYWFPILDNRVLAHAHLGLLGWLGLSYVAVAEKLWPMFLLAHRPHVRDGERAVWFVGAGAPLVAIGLLVDSRAATTVGGVLMLVGLTFHLASLASVIRHRRRGLELLHGFVLASAACLVAAMLLGAVAGIASLDVATRTHLVAAEVLAAILWLLLAVVGHS
ncbi:MAG: DUF2249 domain-containing protein, partial [Actinobacteria bacterium]|nr:DUF2249 domain-containing protein [Actinomycetota bacterium]